MWVLVLVFTLTSQHGGVSVATSQITGFSSKLTCLQAGASIDNLKRYECVEVKGYVHPKCCSV